MVVTFAGDGLVCASRAAVAELTVQRVRAVLLINDEVAGIVLG